MRSMQPVDLPDKKPAVGNTEMEKMWAEAAQAFQDICGQSLQNSTVQSFDDVQTQIESAGEASYKAGDKDQKDKWAKAKAVGLTSLKYLKILVGVVSQATDFIPIPSSAVSLSANALFFVFDIPGTIKGYNEAINQVFGEVSPVLSQFHIYTSMDNIDPALIRQIHLVMISFVKLCAHVVKYRQSGKWSRVWQQTRSILDEDPPLKHEKEELERVLQNQRDVEGTITLAVVVETRHDLELLLQQSVIFSKTTEETLEAVQSLKHDADRMQTLITIRDTLDVKGTVLLDTNTTLTCTNIYNRCLEGTGSWIWTHEAYTAWTASYSKGEDPPPHMLIVSGPPSSGKTSTSAIITKRLEEQKGRSYVAHYFFPTNTKRSDDDKNPVQSALKYMAFQMARVDPVVRKTLGKACKAGPAAFRRSHSPGSLGTLWRELTIGTSGTGATYTFIFDGLENLPDKQATMLLEFVSVLPYMASTGHIRALVSGTDEVFTGCMSSNNGRSALRIQIDECNQPDMRIQIEDVLAKKGMLQCTKAGSVQQRAKEEILEKLPQKVNGSYSRLQQELDEIVRLLGARKDLGELGKLLDTTTNSYETAIKNLLRSLTTDEVRELNELLRWVLYANCMLSLDELEAAMFLYSDTSSLVSLQYVIKNKYSAVLKVDGNHVTVQDGVMEYLEKEKNMRAARSSHAQDHPTISMTVTINNVDQETCADFLWDLAHKAIRDKFDFGIAASSSQAVMMADALEAHHTIALRVFKYLSGEPHDQTKAIGRYLVTWLPHHLGQLRNLEDTDKGALTPIEKIEIGQNLYNLFKDEEMVWRHQEVFEQTWWSSDEIEHLRKWLADSSVTRKLNKKWRDEVWLATDSTTGFLKAFVKMVVEGFLRSRKWDPRNASSGWIREFMASSLRQPSINEPETASSSSLFPPNDALTPAEWNELGAWCQEFLQLPDSALDSLWYERLGDAMLGCGSDADAALSIYQRGISKDSHNWRCRCGLGMAYIAKERNKEALAELELALEEAEREDAEPKPTAKDIVSLHLTAGKSAYGAGNTEEATKHYLVARNSADEEQATEGHLGYLRLMLDSENSEKVLQMLQGSLADEAGRSRMVAVLKKVALESDHMKFIGKLFIVANADQKLLADIVSAMETATTTTTMTHWDITVEDDEVFSEDEACGVLLYHRGMAAYRYNVVPRDSGAGATDVVEAALKLWHASRNLLTGVGGRNAFHVRREATAALAQHYFQNMVDGNHLEHVSTLNQLVADEPERNCYREDARSDAVGLLGALYAQRGQKAQAQDMLRPRLLQALQILSDDIPDNDRIGISAIGDTMLRYRDFRNAAVSIALRGVPDLVTSALDLDLTDVDGGLESKGIDKQHVVDMAATLAEKVVTIVKAHVPDASQQIQRIEMAKAQIDAAITVADGQNETLEEPPEAAVVRSIFQSRLSVLLQKHAPEINLDALEWGLSCDGNLPDGRRCGKRATFAHDPVFYRCIYCLNLDFCQDCLDRLRACPKTGVETTCNGRHCWLRMPPLGADMFVGPRVTSVRVPAVQSVAGDDRVWEICYDDMEEAELITVADWKMALAKEWGILMDDA